MSDQRSKGMRTLLLFVAGPPCRHRQFCSQDPGPALERIAFGSCNKEYKPQLIWKAIRESKPDLWVWLGDIVYGSAKNLPDLERRYRTEKEQPDYKALRGQCRIVGVWDDNDYGVSDGGKDNPNKVERPAPPSPRFPRRATAKARAGSRRVSLPVTVLAHLANA